MNICINLKLYLSIVFCTLALLSCESDQPDEDGDVIFSAGNNGVYISNEGNFQFGNAEISYYNIDEATVVRDVYEPKNNAPLGDVCQSLTLHNHKIYAVINNSEKIEIINSDNHQSIGRIEGLASPRYFLPVTNQKAYVTDLYSDKISIVNLANNTISGSISCKASTEKMCYIHGKVFVTNLESNFLWIIDTSLDEIIDSVDVGFGSNSIQQDANGKLWVLTSGSSENTIPGKLIRLNPINHEIEQEWVFSGNTRPKDLNINGDFTTLYFLNNGVYKMDIADNFLPSQSLITEGNSRVFYGLGVHPKSEDIFIADAIDYVQRGNILIYSSEGVLKDDFKAGIIPNDFYFVP